MSDVRSMRPFRIRTVVAERGEQLLTLRSFSVALRMETNAIRLPSGKVVRLRPEQIGTLLEEHALCSEDEANWSTVERRLCGVRLAIET